MTDVLPFTLTVLACDRCGRRMTDPDTQQSFYGCKLSLDTPAHLTASFERIYPDVPANFSVTLCWACWLSSLGMSPEQVSRAAVAPPVPPSEPLE